MLSHLTKACIGEGKVYQTLDRLGKCRRGPLVILRLKSVPIAGSPPIARIKIATIFTRSHPPTHAGCPRGGPGPVSLLHNGRPAKLRCYPTVPKKPLWNGPTELSSTLYFYAGAKQKDNQGQPYPHACRQQAALAQ